MGECCIEVPQARIDEVDRVAVVQVDDDQPPGVLLNADPPADLDTLLIAEVPEAIPIARHFARSVAGGHEFLAPPQFPLPYGSERRRRTAEPQSEVVVAVNRQLARQAELREHP